MKPSISPTLDWPSRILALAIAVLVGLVVPDTRQPIDGPHHLGHVPGQEWWRIRDLAARESWTRPQLNDHVNNPDLYQIEKPISNMSHRFEMPR